MKKFMAFLLAAIIFLSCLPYGIETVYANVQNPVIRQQLIVVESGAGSNTYGLRFVWERPTPEQVNDPPNTSHVPPDGGAGWYEILYSRKGSSNPTDLFDNSLSSGDARTDTEFTISRERVELEKSGIYTFRIRPFHYEVANIQNQAPVSTIKYPAANSYRDMLLLTDIAVTAGGSGNTLTVSWENPTLDGQELFEAWDIYYVMDTTGNPTYGDPIRISSDRLVRIGNTLSYSITNDAIKPLQQYSVKIEPVFNGEQLRKRRKPFEFTFNGKTYSDFAFSLQNNNRDYEYIGALIKMPLDYEEADLDNIVLYWSGLSSFEGIYRIDIESSISPNFDYGGDFVGAIIGERDCREISNYPVRRPSRKTYYRLKIYYKVGNIDRFEYSEIVEYDPDFSDFAPNKPTIKEFYSVENPLSLSVVWEAFLRSPFTMDEEQFLIKEGPYTGLYLDKNVEYDIYIADDLALLNELTVFERFASVPAYNLQEYIREEDGAYVFRMDGIQEYYTRASGVIEKVSGIRANKIYYIKIVARQLRDDPELIGKESEPAYSAYFVPTDDVLTNPYMLSKPPLRIKKDEDGLEVITNTTVDLTFETQYYEVYNPDDNSWYSKVGVRNGSIIYGDRVSPEDSYVELTSFGGFDVTNGENGIGAAKALLAQRLGIDADLLAVRYIDLTDAFFELHVVDYDTYSTYSSYEEYVLAIAGEDSAWSGPVADTNTNPTRELSVTDLEPLTSYMFIIRPYIFLDGEKLTSYRPSGIVATTLTDRPEVEITPTVPILIPVEEGSTYLIVKWLYKSNLFYELKYSEYASDYPDLGVTITQEQIAENGKLAVENGETYMHYKIEKLFPESNYHLWIRSAVQNPSGVAYSVWSNFISMRTTDVKPPSPPTGLGLVGAENLEIYNRQNNQTYTPVDYNYIIMEWNRDLSDDVQGELQEMTEVHEILNIPANVSSYIVKFNELNSNTPYYARVKARLTVSRVADGSSLSEYQYIIQLSQDDEFTDYHEVTVPETITGGQEAGGLFIRLESEWSKVVRIYSGKWDGEYDGNVDPITYPMPSSDFELIFDYLTGTLTYRFRSRGIDAAGNHDNGADHRFITRLISSGTYNFTVDLSKYGSAAPTRRIIEIPYSIASAFADRHISLTFICGNTTYFLPSGFLNVPEVNNMAGYGHSATVKITALENPPNTPRIDALTETFAVNPSRLTINVSNGQNSVNMQRLGAEMNISQTILNLLHMQNRNVGGYMHLENVDSWVRGSYTFDENKGVVSQTTRDLGSFAVISQISPVGNRTDIAAEEAMSRVNKKIAIMGITSFLPNNPVTPGEFNKIVCAVARGLPAVNITEALTSEELNSMQKAGMLITSPSSVTREEGINSLVKLYENRTKEFIRTHTSLESTPYSDIAFADERYKASLLKAGDIGFLDETSYLARPKDIMSFSEFIKIIDKIVSMY